MIYLEIFLVFRKNHDIFNKIHVIPCVLRTNHSYKGRTYETKRTLFS